MDTVRKTLWYIESHLEQPVTLDELAAIAGISRFHLSRSFAQAIGRSVTAHLRGRRLSEAARQLVDGAPDILSVALDAGYGSHEAFSRAFRDQFGRTPDDVRAGADLTSLKLVEPILMPDTPITAIETPEIRAVDGLLLAGLRRFFTYEDRAGIPLLWQRFGPHIDNIPGQIKGDAYGVCLKADGDPTDGFDYLAAVPMRSLNDLPDSLVGVRIPPLTFAVFQHQGHVSNIGATCAAAGEWLASERRMKPGVAVMMVEYYPPQFDPRTGLGGCEVWVPVSD
nr:helix-turn-helix domain-containing protein [Kaistia soli]